MAKIGEEDPRWIVEDRVDGRNVNSWHWEDRDGLPWVKKRLGELFTDSQVYAGDDVVCTITKVDSISGEAYYNNRKGKLFCFYELDVKLCWKAETKSDGEKATGKFKLPYISDENDLDDFEVQVALEDADKTKTRVKEAVNRRAVPVLRKTIVDFLKELKAGGDLRANIQQLQQQQQKQQQQQQQPSQTKSQEDQKTAQTQNKNIRTATVKLTEKFRASPALIYDALLNESKISAYTQSKCTLKREAGGQFSFFGGSITGSIVELSEGQKIVQKWRFSDWAEDVYSLVTITLSQQSDETVLELVHVDIPLQDKYGNPGVTDRVEKGWRMHFFERIKGVFGYGFGPSASSF